MRTAIEEQKFWTSFSGGVSREDRRKLLAHMRGEAEIGNAPIDTELFRPLDCGDSSAIASIGWVVSECISTATLSTASNSCIAYAAAVAIQYIASRKQTVLGIDNNAVVLFSLLISTLPPLEEAEAAMGLRLVLRNASGSVRGTSLTSKAERFLTIQAMTAEMRHRTRFPQVLGDRAYIEGQFRSLLVLMESLCLDSAVWISSEKDQYFPERVT